jgi:hypothetical protein
MTYFTINDEHGPIPIPSGKGFGASNFCAGAQTDELIDNYTYEMHVSKVNEAFEKEYEAHTNDVKSEPLEEPKVVDVSPPVRRNFFTRTLFFICGIETLANQKEDEKEVDMDVSIDQNQYWSRIINISAIFVAAIAGFFIAFFNKY